MSDPVTNAEIEDVLSSIRRLVSDDPSPLNRRKRVAEGAKERFVLTPALRVSEDAQDDAAEPEEALQPDAGQDAPFEAAEPEQPSPEDAGETVEAGVAEEEPESPAAVTMQDRFADSRQTLEQRIAELEAALQQSPEEWEPDGSEVAKSEASTIPDFDDDPESDAAPDSDEIVLDAESLAWADDSDEPEDEDEEPQAALVEDQDESERFSDLAAAISEALNEVDPDEVDLDEAVDEDDLALIESDDPAPEADDPFEADPEDVGHAAASLYPTDLRPKQPMPERDLQESAPEALDAEDPDDEELHVDDAVAAKPSGKNEDDEPAPFELFEDAVMDEEALRDMVSQLVRDELQGVLGERITRNVRRLVRREIQRAIAMRELE